MMGGVRGLRRDRSVLKENITPGTWRRMLKFVWPYRRILSVFLVMVVVDAAISVVNPLIFREVINKGIIGKDLSVVIDCAALLAGLAVLDAALSIGMRWVSARVGESLIYDLRTKVFGHIQRMPLAFFTRTQTGALISRLNNDVLGAQQAFTDTLSSVVSNLMTVILVLATMLVLSWQITLVALVILPVFVIPAKRMGARLAKITRESYELNASMNATMSERFNVSGALLVKLFGRPGEELTSFSQRAGRVRDIGIKQALYARLFFVALMLTASLATALVYGWGGALAIAGVLNVGTIVALTSYLNRLYGPLIGLSNVQLDVMTALVSFDRVFEVLDLEPMIAEKPEAKAITAGPAQIEFDHVDFSYPRPEEVSLASLESVAVLDSLPDQQILHDITFTAEPGQLVALVGPSGAGKTTISYLVSRIYDPRGGAIRINGTDLRDATMDSLRVHRRHGHPGRAPVPRHHPGEPALRQPGRDRRADRRSVARSADPVADRILPQGLDTVVGDRGYRLSGGEKQRLAIARLLLKAPVGGRARRGHRASGLGVRGCGAARRWRPRCAAGPAW